MELYFPPVPYLVSKILHLRDTLDSSRLETIVHEYCHIMQKENGMHLSRYDSELEAYTSSLPFSTLDFIQEDVPAYDSFMQLVTVASKRPSTNSKRSI